LHSEQSPIQNGLVLPDIGKIAQSEDNGEWICRPIASIVLWEDNVGLNNDGIGRRAGVSQETCNRKGSKLGNGKHHGLS
jgi:hypothetical protein